MRNRIFKGIITVALIVWLASLAVILGALYAEYSGEYRENIKTNAYLVAAAVEQGGEEYLNSISKHEKYRITWVSETGKVLYDSDADPGEMGNHKSRPEIREAMKKGYGEETRYSRTLAQKTTYSAVRLKDKSVIRVSESQFTLFMMIIRMSQPILAVLLLAFILSFLLAKNMSKRIVDPINKIDVNDPMASECYEEIEPLLFRISEQNKQLNGKISTLQDDVSAKTREAEFRKEFTANVSHELKTPLTSISGYAEIIQNGIAREEDIPRFAERIYTEAQRLIVLVDDIIKLSQLDENQVSARKETVDLYEMCSETIDSLDDAASKKDVKIRQLGDHVLVSGVFQILEEIVYNLIDNAVKYNRDGGEVFVETGKRDTRPFVRVKDTGIGIPKEDLDRVFERFYRVNKSHSKEIGGTGLGLSIVKHGALYHNADIGIESEPGKGTTITITFPGPNSGKIGTKEKAEKNPREKKEKKEKKEK
ncbi:MAG: ATP-binding protein [Anaerovoracaceae bacterium]